jgi:hypothetical protein
LAMTQFLKRLLFGRNRMRERAILEANVRSGSCIL